MDGIGEQTDFVAVRQTNVLGTVIYFVESDLSLTLIWAVNIFILTIT
jgi:hypothetical protein